MFAVTWWQSTELVSYRFTYARRGAGDVERQLSFSEINKSRAPFDEVTINAWLAQQIPLTHPIWQRMVEHPGLDPWKRPYRCVRNRTLADGTLVDLGVYSMGKDGVSNSEGNDPDDLNSWNEQQGGYYYEEIKNTRFAAAAIIGLLLTPFTYALLYALIRLTFPNFLKPHTSKENFPP